ncbi:MAG: lamin tail domain-containing protein [Methanosarcina flavescens]|jgi:competence protein ComEC|uniref:MBL fold metallo-hydrolase n=1 Tax=Methanosarcina flavescens TaxID=1715806 RepID=A0A660HSV7_9EURY|nr:lamin tail domain-containing protein [Methanosarcina flavescens]AYK15411.1 MBL fold metallo-hydrolase [Methanosarcina flavescens]NLK33795.1 MBL fold metallo-hydrolase [Methanosarcina flavescens]
MRFSQLTAAAFVLTLVLIAAGCTDPEETPLGTVSEQTSPSTVAAQNTVTVSGQNLTVHFLDVGQGDSILLELDGKFMLVDSGERDQGKVVTAYLQNQGISTLDYVVATHPHSDHIGGMDDILNNFPVEHFVDSGYPHTSKTYENMLIIIDTKDIPFEVVQAGHKIDFDPAVDIEVLNPASIYSDELNENSVVLKVTYGETSFLLMGDAGLESEEYIIEAGYDVDSDILKVGHHASRSGSGRTFISAVSPEVSIVEVGAGNDYGHPHAEVLDRLQKVSTVYRTDLDGTIVITTDGSTYTVTTEKTRNTSSRNEAYASTDSTAEVQSEEYVDSSSTEPTVYVSDLNLQDEWVQISNTGASPVSLNGWKIEDEGSKHTYTFQSYTLNAGTTVTVFTGKGANSATELYWQLDNPVWNNNGDTAYLYDDSGKLVSKLES